MSDEQNNVIELKPPKCGKKRWLLFGAILFVVLALLVWFILSKSTALDGVKRWFRYLGRDTEALAASPLKATAQRTTRFATASLSSARRAV